MMLTPAEVIWGLIVLLAAAWWRIVMVADFGEHSSIPTTQVGYSIDRGAAGAIGQPVAAVGWAGLAAEATRTDTLIWYATQLLGEVTSC